MSISLVEPPSKRSSGRHPRLSDEDIQDLANALKAGKWASDNESVDTKSAAYQRAQSARDLILELLGDKYTIKKHKAKDGKETSRKVYENTFGIKTAVEPVDINNLTKGYVWKVGPREQG